MNLQEEDEASILGASTRQKDGGHSKSPLSSRQRCESGAPLMDKPTIVMLSGPARSPAISVTEVQGFFQVPVSVVKAMVAREMKSDSSRIYVKFGTPDDAQRAFHAVADSRYSPNYADVSTLNAEFLRPDQVLSVLHVSNFPRTPKLEDVKRILPPGANIQDIHILEDNSTSCHVWVSVCDIDTAKTCFIRLSGQLLGDKFLTVSFVPERGNMPDHRRPLENGLNADSSTSVAEQTMAGKQDSSQASDSAHISANIDFLGLSNKAALPEVMAASKTTPSSSIHNDTENTPAVHQQEIGDGETTQFLDHDGDFGEFRQQQKRKRGEAVVNSRQRKRIDSYDSDWNSRSQGTWYSPADPQAANESFANEFVIPAKLRNIPAIQPPPPPEGADLTWSEPAQSSSVLSTAAFETITGGQVDLPSSNHIHPDRISRITLDKQAANRIIMNQINGNGRQTQGTKAATRWPTRQDGSPEDGEIAEDSVVLAKARQEKPRRPAEHATSASNGDAMDVDKTSHRGNSVAAGVYAWGPVWQGELRLTGEKQEPRLFQCAFVGKGSSRPWTTIPSSLSCIMDDPSAPIQRLQDIVKDPRAEFLLLKEKNGAICTSFITENSLLKVGKICVDEDRTIYLVPLFALGQLPPSLTALMRNIRKSRLYKHLLAVYLDKKAPPNRTSNEEGWEVKRQYAQLDWKDFFKRKDQTSEATATPAPDLVEPPTPDSSVLKDVNDELTSQPVPIPAPACQILEEEKVNALPSMDKIYYAVEVEGEGPKSRKYLSFPGLRNDLINYALKCFVKEEDADGEVMFIPVNKWLEWHTTLSAFREAPAPETLQMTSHVPLPQQNAFMQAALGYPGSAFMVVPVHPGFASGLSASGINGLPFTGWSHGAAGMHTAEIGSYGADAGYVTRRPRESRTFDAASAHRVTEMSTDRPPIPHADKSLLEQAQWLEAQATVMRRRMSMLNMKKGTGPDSC
ncbi:hypothetical protein BC832DRAFT_412425 [Gaertneriomyces semiglobifer]|nr:hypothetical protein BC832DRAFT_412425 [Gaertneriomyces semiglobifer]